MSGWDLLREQDVQHPHPQGSFSDPTTDQHLRDVLLGPTRVVVLSAVVFVRLRQVTRPVSQGRQKEDTHPRLSHPTLPGVRCFGVGVRPRVGTSVSRRVTRTSPTEPERPITTEQGSFQGPGRPVSVPTSETTPPPLSGIGGRDDIVSRDPDLSLTPGPQRGSPTPSTYLGREEEGVESFSPDDGRVYT